MPVATALPPGLKNKKFTRNSPGKQLSCEIPPIQYIPSPLPKARSTHAKATIKIFLPSNVSKTYRVFVSGNLEQAINHVQLVLAIIEDYQIESKILAAKV